MEVFLGVLRRSLVSFSVGSVEVVAFEGCSLVGFVLRCAPLLQV